MERNALCYLSAVWGLLFFFTFCMIGCNNDVPRPDTNMCLNNVGLLQVICYNLKNDYDSNGNLKSDAKPMIVQFPTGPAMLASLDKNIGTNPAGWASLKAYLRELRGQSP